MAHSFLRVAEGIKTLLYRKGNIHHNGKFQHWIFEPRLMISFQVYAHLIFFRLSWMP